jgi:tetratricopeptide (TPR) repeat protein
MKFQTRCKLGIIAVSMALVLSLPAVGQYREYYIKGKVLDTQNKPIEGVEITLRDEGTSRGYNAKTNKNGEFSFVGLPHGVYKATLAKEGYVTKEDEWKFETPQAKMEKVEIPPVVLATQQQIQKAEQLKEAAGEVKEATEKVRQGDYDGAISLADKVLAKDPKDANALYLKGMAYLKKGEWENALPFFLNVNELAPRFPPAFYHAAVCYQQLKDTEKALSYYTKAMELDPENPDAPYNAGLVLFGLNRIDEALPLFEKTLALRPDDPAALEMAGRCYIHQAKFAQAVEYLEKAKPGYANDPEKIKFLDDLIEKLKQQIKK